MLYVCSPLVAQTVKCLPAMRETQVRFLGQEYHLEKEMAIHSSTLAWKIPWMKEPVHVYTYIYLVIKAFAIKYILLI